MTRTVNLDFTRAVFESLETNYGRLQSTMCANRLWERCFTNEEKGRLGGSLRVAFRDGGTVGMWMRLRGVTDVRAIIDLAKSLGFIDEGTQRWLLRETHESSDDPDEALAMALERADLVLTEQPRAVYWRRCEIDVDWEKNSALWNYFLTLCERTKKGLHIDAADFGDRRKSDNHIKLKSRLTTRTQGFPQDLGTLITAHRGGKQTLDIAPNQIRILR